MHIYRVSRIGCNPSLTHAGPKADVAADLRQEKKKKKIDV